MTNCKLKTVLLGLVLAASAGSQEIAGEELTVVTTTTDLAAIAEAVGGSGVQVMALAKGYQDPHFVDPKPSLILKLKRADVFIQIGLDLEIGWVPPLLQASRNSQILPGAAGHIDASSGIRLLEIPAGNPADLRAKGDIHAYGNPHYWLNPQNGKFIANTIARRFSELQPGLAADFQRNAEFFAAQIDSSCEVWKQKIQPFRHASVVAYHNSWPYFSEYFGIEIAGFIEPKPGIPASPRHLISIIKMMSERKIKTIIISPYLDQKAAVAVARRTDAEIVQFAPSVEALPDVETYFDLFEKNIDALIRGFEKKGIAPVVATE